MMELRSKLVSDSDTKITSMPMPTSYQTLNRGGAVKLVPEWNETSGNHCSTLGVTVAGEYFGSGNKLTGIVTSVVEGNNILINTSPYCGIVTISSTAAGTIWNNDGKPGSNR